MRDGARSPARPCFPRYPQAGLPVCLQDLIFVMFFLVLQAKISSCPMNDEPKNVRSGEELDADALQRYLSERLEGFRAISKIRQFPGGIFQPDLPIAVI